MFYMIVILAAIFAMPAFGQGVDPLIGSWKLNLEKSTSTAGVLPAAGTPAPLAGGPPFKSLTLTWSGEGQNFIDTVEGVDAQGQPFKGVLRHIYDGMHQATGSQDFDSITYTRIGNTINYVRFKQSKAVGVGQIVMVPGKTITITGEDIDVNNQPHRTVGVYDRQ
jgi:hypothetical protein